MESKIQTDGNILNMPENIKILDSKSQFDDISIWDQLIEESINITKGLEFPENIKIGSKRLEYSQEFKNILVCGMGGSAIGGEYTETYLRDHLPIPIFINRKHTIPNFVGPNTLVISCSYSGNTEETIRSTVTALSRGAPVIAITSGGMIEEVCKQKNLPIIKVKSGMQPRAAFPLLFPPIPILLSELVNKNIVIEDFKHVIKILRIMESKIGVHSEIDQNPAKQIALSIAGNHPLICSFMGCLSYRMRCQLNENAKMPATNLEFPELGHNFIVAFESLARNLKDFSLLHLDILYREPSMEIRFKFLEELVTSLGLPIHTIPAEGENLLSRMLSLTYFGDYVSLYSAILRGFDPSPVDTISRMKLKIENAVPWKNTVKTQFQKLIF